MADWKKVYQVYIKFNIYIVRRVGEARVDLRGNSVTGSAMRPLPLLTLLVKNKTWHF